jgi:hypothetical protein
MTSATGEIVESERLQAMVLAGFFAVVDDGDEEPIPTAPGSRSTFHHL